MKKGERRQASMENVQGLDGWQSLARTVISVAVQESEGHLIMTSRECQMKPHKREELKQEAKKFLESESEYKDLLFDIATFEKDTGDNITDGTDCTIQ